MNREELVAYLQDKDLPGVDSEYTYTTRHLVEAFNADGAHLNRWWVMTPVEWTCPCCGRNKSEIVRVNKNNYLTCQLHEHHDHMKEVVRFLFEDFSIKRKQIVADELSEKFAIKTAFALSAYDNTVVCFDCNKADSDAKALIGINKYFSFSPREISEFILVSNNKEHEIDEQAARNVWERVRPIFEMRLEMARRFARIAAEKKDWYQPSERTARQVERIARHHFGHLGLLELDKTEPERLLYNTEPFRGIHKSWRIKRNPRTKKQPTVIELSHLAATRGKYWKRYRENWVCPCCNRTKYHCVRPSKNNPWVLEIKSAALFLERTNSVDYKPDPVCMDCLDSAINWGQEVLKESGATVMFPSSVISLAELSRAVVPRPHSRHEYRNEFIDKIMPLLIERAYYVESIEYGKTV